MAKKPDHEKTLIQQFGSSLLPVLFESQQQYKKVTDIFEENDTDLIAFSTAYIQEHFPHLQTFSIEVLDIEKNKYAAKIEFFMFVLFIMLNRHLLLKKNNAMYSIPLRDKAKHLKLNKKEKPFVEEMLEQTEIEYARISTLLDAEHRQKWILWMCYTLSLDFHQAHSITKLPEYIDQTEYQLQVNTLVRQRLESLHKSLDRHGNDAEIGAFFQAHHIRVFTKVTVMGQPKNNPLDLQVQMHFPILTLSTVPQQPEITAYVYNDLDPIQQQIAYLLLQGLAEKNGYTNGVLPTITELDREEEKPFVHIPSNIETPIPIQIRLLDELVHRSTSLLIPTETISHQPTLFEEFWGKTVEYLSSTARRANFFSKQSEYKKDSHSLFPIEKSDDKFYGEARRQIQQASHEFLDLAQMHTNSLRENHNQLSLPL